MNNKVLTILLLVNSLFVFRVASQNIVCDSSIKLNNTMWSGNDSDGSFQEFTFLDNGQLSYKSNKSRNDTVNFKNEEDVWIINDNKVIIVLNNYVTYLGNVDGEIIEGAAWNITGKRWKWKVKKQSNIPNSKSAVEVKQPITMHWQKTGLD